MRNTGWFCGLWLLAALLLVPGCGAPPEPLPILRIGHAPHDHHAPLYVAAMNPEYFEQHGGTWLKEVRFREEYLLMVEDRPVARVLVESSTGGGELIRRLSEDQFDVSFGGVPAMLKFIDKGRPIRILAPVMAEGAGLVVSNDLPPNNWGEFLDYVRQRERPLKIGYKSAVSVQNLIFEHALTASAIPFSVALDDTSARIILINLNGARHLIPALESGLIDGFVVMQPYLALAQFQGSGKLIALLRDLPPEGKWHGHPCCALAASNRFVQSRPELAETLLTLILRAKRFIIEHPEKSAQQVARWLGLPPEVEEHSLPTIDFSVDLDPSWGRGIDFWLEAMIDSGRLDGKVREAHRGGKLDALIYDRDLYRKASGNPE